MVGVPSPLGGSPEFDSYDEFAAANQPEPGEFLDGHDVLTGREHIAFHRLSRALFEERKVYDMTFNYNLARLNLDPRHPDAGYRYAEERADGERGADAAGEPPIADGDERVLRAEFTPTTPFCPQSNTLTKGSFRAWHALADRHEYDLIRVRVAPMHHQAGAINDQLRDLEEAFSEHGELATIEGEVGSNPMERSMREEGDHRGPSAPF